MIARKSIPLINPLWKNERFYLVFSLLLICLIAIRIPVDHDLYWHLRAGEETIKNGNVLLIDTFSYTRNGTPWLNHSWLSEVILFLVYKTSGWYGLAILAGFLSVGSLLFIYPQLTGHPLQRSFVLVFTAIVASAVWSPRPQMFTLVLLSLTSLILYQFKNGSKKILWILPILFMIWSNLHAGFSLGLLLLFITLLGTTLDHFGKGISKYGYKHPDIQRLSIVVVLSVFSVIINPNGIEVWKVPFQTIGVQSLQNFISEWASPDFHQINQIPFLVFLLLLIFSLGKSSKKTTWLEICRVGMFTCLALLARRNIGPFALMTAPVLSGHIWEVSQNFGQFIKLETFKTRGVYKINREFTEKMRQIINIGLILILCVAVAVKTVNVCSQDVIQRTEEGLFPVKAVNWIQENQPEERMFSSYNWGGYLIWYLGSYPVFVDGRTDLYGDEVITEWLRVVEAREGWQEVLNRWSVKTILLEPDRLVFDRLVENGWKMRYQDDMAVVYTR